MYDRNYSGNCWQLLLLRVCLWIYTTFIVLHVWANVTSAALPAAHDLQVSSNSWFLWFKRLPDPGGFFGLSIKCFLYSYRNAAKKALYTTFGCWPLKKIVNVRIRILRIIFPKVWLLNRLVFCWVLVLIPKDCLYFLWYFFVHYSPGPFFLCLLKEFLICFIWPRLHDLICMAVRVST